jgi:CheY-like chemotaxis protein
VHVLVVDDSPDIRFMLRVLLEDAGMDVEESPSGDAALERLLGDAAEPLPDAVVLDQRMPGMTGLEVARELTRSELGVPLILFSAYLHQALHEEAVGLGVVPVVKTDLNALVDELRGLLPVAV